MNLLIDLGNHRLKWAAVGDRPVRFDSNGLDHDGRNLPAALMTHWAALPRPRRLLVASVAGRGLERAMAECAQALWRIEPEFLEAEAVSGSVTNGYRQPRTLGSDRWAALLGAAARGLAPCCIVDAGTAVTVDVLDSAGRHRGGMIFAGLGLSRVALARGTDRLPVVVERGVAALADDTESAILLGTREALIGAVERILGSVRTQFPGVRVVLSGGDAALLASALSAFDPVLQDDLVFAGLVTRLEVG